ncbi:MAG: WYL domain-containing protein, partial [Nitrospira sp.]|nr:WYL domain-containing protein [Nitrospira sp.]
MRYEKTDRMLELCHELQFSRIGLTLEDIQERFSVGRRTAQRMKNAVLRVYSQTQEWYDDERRKRWRIPQDVSTPVGEISADELADLEFAIKSLRKQNDRRRAKSIESLVTKVKAQISQKAASRIEPDLEALLEAEGLAMRPGPRPIIRDEIVDALRRAIKEGSEVYIVHRNRERGTSSGRVIHPYGFLFGNRNYLVATSPERHPNEPRLYGLPEIEKVTIKAKSFSRLAGFSLKAFAERSFGVWQ